jgi:hydroxymethylbilane synthase
MSLKVGTRGSRLALAQAERVVRKLGESGQDAEISIITTEGDTIDGVPLHEIGGQGVFVRALDEAILTGSIDPVLFLRGIPRQIFLFITLPQMKSG